MLLPYTVSVRSLARARTLSGGLLSDNEDWPSLGISKSVVIVTVYKPANLSREDKQLL
jgi:hypothetical protein